VHADHGLTKPLPSPRATAPPAGGTRFAEFEAFYKDQYRRLVGFLIVVHGADLTAAEDAAQEAMRLALKNWTQLENAGAWIRTVALRNYWHSSRRDHKRQDLEQEFAAEQPETAEDPADALQIEEQMGTVLGFINALPPAQREVFLYVFDDHSPTEIAKLVGKNPATVRSLLLHARRKLAQLLGAEPAVGAETRED